MPYLDGNPACSCNAGYQSKRNICQINGLLALATGAVCTPIHSPDNGTSIEDSGALLCDDCAWPTTGGGSQRKGSSSHSLKRTSFILSHTIDPSIPGAGTKNRQMLAVALGVDTKPVIGSSQGVVEMQSRQGDKGEVVGFNLQRNYSVVTHGHDGHPIGVPTLLKDGTVLIPMSTGLQLWSSSRPSFFYTDFDAVDGVSTPAVGSDGTVCAMQSR